MLDAAVVCKELGCGAALSASGDAHFGEGSGPVVTWSVRCRGSESTLRGCRSQPWGGGYSWLHSYDAGVICSGGNPPKLVNGDSRCVGRVELYNYDTWRTVCGETLNMEMAGYICKYLGCGFAVSVSSDARFGEGSGPVVGRPDCGHGQDGGIFCSDPLQKAIISLKPDSPFFVRGESAQISCSGNYPGSIFSLYIDGKIFTSRTAPENIQTANFALSDFSAGIYTCKYTTHVDGRKFTSPESERVGIYLWEPLQKPTISLKPDSRVFVRGESAEISCSGNYPGSNFSLYREGKLISSQWAPEKNNTATFAPSEISAGNYSCKYAKHIVARELTSPESERVGISLWDPHQKAKISLEPDSRVFVRGESAEISCSGNYPGSNFSLYRDDAFIISQAAPENNNTATFILSEISAANYTCKYTTQIDGRVFTSIASERVGITVRANWTWKQITGLAAGIVAALMIIVLLLGISEYKKGKQKSSSGERNVPTGGGPEPSNVTCE
ncbi:scavenger receptor cysteine-rich type 1 protein M130-like isoform X2 [Callorhinchus milii]|uniref:scavenger receptor cysteine-rich type 1 protein M130-like isoform X2 n=1 Tax=Callorhinchus milii TaxID=7868 RepID=UPI001C3FA18E|nr:scavenger receptor cysteine-rich type 1 protein M130-like isoform X2 [Callorhinchus milii]